MENEQIIKIVTHDGGHHADDVMAVAILSMLHLDAVIVRSRDKADIADATFVIDVGGEYVPELGRFDHHQRNFQKVRENGIPYAAAGLVWETYGEALVAKCATQSHSVPVAEIAKHVDECVMQPIDANDTGHSKAGYGSFPAAITAINAPWIVNRYEANSSLEYEQFLKSVDFSVEYLKGVIYKAIGGYIAQAEVEEAIEESESPVLVFNGFLPWITTLLDSKQEKAKDIMFVVFPTKTDWKVQAVPSSKKTRALRTALPNAWRGLRQEELAEVTGIKDAVFCHAEGFIAGAVSRESAIALAELALAAA